MSTATATSATERKTNKIEARKVKKGDLMAMIYWVRVEKAASGGEELVVDDVDNNTRGINVRGKELVESSFSADQFAEEEKVTKTQAAELLISSHNRPLTVSFEKQDGTERVLRGRLVKHEALLGRSMVEDLEVKDAKNRLRQVDHRTIKWLVVDGVKYVVK